MLLSLWDGVWGDIWTGSFRRVIKNEFFLKNNWLFRGRIFFALKTPLKFEGVGAKGAKVCCAEVRGAKVFLGPVLYAYQLFFLRFSVGNMVVHFSVCVCFCNSEDISRSEWTKKSRYAQKTRPFNRLQQLFLGNRSITFHLNHIIPWNFFRPNGAVIWITKPLKN